MNEPQNSQPKLLPGPTVTATDPKPEYKRTLRGGTGRFTSKLPIDHQKRWPQLLELIEENGLSWYEAYAKVYPEITDKDAIINRVKALRYNNASFRKYLNRRLPLLGNSEQFTRKELKEQWYDIARFNLAHLYEMDNDGNVALKRDWLTVAKKHNVLQKIVITRTKKITKSGDEYITEVINIVPYSRTDALTKVGKLLGYEVLPFDSNPDGIKTFQQNNTYIVNQIENIRKNMEVKEANLPGSEEESAAEEINEDYIKSLGEAEIITGNEDKD